MVTKKQAVLNVVWADVTDTELKTLRKQVESAIADPKGTVIANYEVNWDQIKLDKNRPPKLVWASDISKEDIKDLRNQFDKAILDPEYPIVVNYKVNIA